MALTFIGGIKQLFVCLNVQVESKKVDVHSIQILSSAVVNNIVQKSTLSCRTVVQCNLITEKQIPSVTNAFSGLLDKRFNQDQYVNILPASYQWLVLRNNFSSKRWDWGGKYSLLYCT